MKMHDSEFDPLPIENNLTWDLEILAPEGCGENDVWINLTIPSYFFVENEDGYSEYDGEGCLNLHLIPFLDNCLHHWFETTYRCNGHDVLANDTNLLAKIFKDFAEKLEFMNTVSKPK